MRTSSEEKQGRLELDEPKGRPLSANVDQAVAASGIVISFVDASTMAVREAAIRRVIASGIFSVSTGLKR